MRKFASFVVLFIWAAAAEAQEPGRQGPDDPALTTVVPVAGADTKTADGTDMRVRSAKADDIKAVRMSAPVETRAPADAEEAVQGIDTPRNFWWLVGGIVLAGLILAALL